MLRLIHCLLLLLLLWGSVFCLCFYVVLSVISSFAIILMGKRESWLLYFCCRPGVVECECSVVLPCIAWVGLQCAIVVFQKYP